MNIQQPIISQYYAALQMLEQVLTRCPDELWDDRSYKNVFWQVAYHALFFTQIYLYPTRGEVVPWPKQRGKRYDMAAGPAGDPYTRGELLEYCALCQQTVLEQVARLDPEAPSGFPWLPFNKLELQFYNLRHLQLHTGELCERLGAHGACEIEWVYRADV